MIGVVFTSSSNMKGRCVFLLKSPHRGHSDEYSQHTIISIKRQSPEIIPNTITAAAMGLFLLGTEEGF